MRLATNLVALAFIFVIGLTQLEAQAPRQRVEPGSAADPFGAPADAGPSEAPAVKIPATKMRWESAAARIEAELAKTTHVDVVEMPLKDVILFLQDVHQIPIVLKSHTLSCANIPRDTPITKTLRGITLAAALRQICDDLELAYYIDEVLVITTAADAQAHPEVRIYDCRDILAGNERTRKLPNEADDHRTKQLIKLITTNVDPLRWAPSSSVGGTISEFDGFIVVTQTAQTHAKVANLLNMYRKAAGFDVPKTASATR